MAYPVAPNAVLEVTIEGSQAGQLVMNVFHYQMTVGSSEDGKALAEEFGDWFQTNVLSNYLATVSADVTNVNLYCQWILPTRYRYHTIAGGPWVGEDINASLPPNDQVSITLQGEKAGRGNIGRKALFGVPRNLVVDGLVVPAGITDYQGIADTFLMEFTGVGGEELYPVIVGTPVDDEYPVVINAFPQTTIRVERRRTVGLGA